jgi:anti-anti-sigma factor
VGKKRSDRGDPRVQSHIDTTESRFAVRGDRRNGVDRLSLIGELDLESIPTFEHELEAVAHAGGALIIDLRALDAVDADGVHALEETAMHAGQEGWWLFIVNSRSLVRDAFERAGVDMLLSDMDVSEVLASGDGEWSPTSLPPLPGERKIRRLRAVKE